LLNIKPIFRADSAEYLGLILNTLNFAEHVNKVKKKINPYVGIIGRIRNYLYQDDLKKLYATSPDVYMKQLSILQKKCIKYVFKLKHKHPSSLVFREYYH
jgi:hypothetical protein